MNKPLETLLTNLAQLPKVKTIVTLVMIGGATWGFAAKIVPVELYGSWVTAVMTYYFTKKESPS